MKLHKAFKHSLEMVLHSKLRSWLTILGIVIGVAAVISIVSIGEGLKQEVNSRLSNLGGDILTVTAGAPRGGGFGFGGGGPPGGGDRGGGGGGGSASKEQVVLDRTDLQALKGMSDVKYIDTEIRGSAGVYYLGKQGTTSVTGVDPAVWPYVTTETLAEGRLFGPTDKNVVIIGGRLSASYFGTLLGINQMFSIGGKSFRVIGILDDESNSIIMPITNAYDVTQNKTRDIYDSFVIKIRNEDDLNQSMANIQDKLVLVRHVNAGKPDFTVNSNKARQQQQQSVTSSITTFLTAIACVALLVGAVGIANTMFTSVLEKTKEIGIMKAIGARNKDILAIFLLNAALIGFIGGVLGIFFGYLLSGFLPGLLGSAGGIAGRFGSATGILTMRTVLGALGISIGIGTISGAVPAYQASKLKPVDALRYG